MYHEFWLGKSVFITGATGAWGTELCRQLCELPVRRIVAFYRGEHRGVALAEKLNDERLRLRLGDVRDVDRLTRASEDCEVVIHAAALKRVDQQSHDAIEIVRTNVLGSVNVLEACITNRPACAVLISSDKAVAPSTSYGATKLTAEYLWLAGNEYARSPEKVATRFIIFRGGNALGSTGSVLHIWKRQQEFGLPLTITVPTMTRFHLTLSEACASVLEAVTKAESELYIPDLPAYCIADLAEAFAPGYPVEIVGSRGFGEKEHEVLEIGGPSSAEARRLSVGELQEILREEGWI